MSIGILNANLQQLHRLRQDLRKLTEHDRRGFLSRHVGWQPLLVGEPFERLPKTEQIRAEIGDGEVHRNSAQSNDHSRLAAQTNSFPDPRLGPA